MSGLVDRLRDPMIGQVARQLEVHPFSMLRILVSQGAEPQNLRMSPLEIETFRQMAGLEQWWSRTPGAEPGESPIRGIARALLKEMLRRGYIDPEFTRSDNLLRGLDTEGRLIMRRCVNLLIKEGYLGTRATRYGLQVGIVSSRVDTVRNFVEHNSGALDSLLRPM